VTRAAHPGHAAIRLPRTELIDRPDVPLTVVAPMPHAHTTVIEVFVRAGSAYEAASDNGVSHLLEHVLLAGSRRHRTRRDMQQAIDATGGFLDALTHKELTEYSFQVLPGRVPEALDLLGEALCHPSFSDEVIESERRIVLEELLTGNYEGARDPFSELLWGTSSIGLPIIGRRAVIERLGRAELERVWRSTYTRDNILICVAGAVDRSVVEGALAVFADLPKGSGPPPRPRPPQERTKPSFQIERFAADATDLCLMLRTPGWSSGDARRHAALFLVTQWYQTHVYQELIGPTLPVYYLNCGQESFVAEGYVYVYFRVGKRMFFATVERILDELDRLRAGGISADALEVSKRRAALGVLSSLDDPREVAYRIGADLLLSGSEHAVSAADELHHIETMTVDEIAVAMVTTFRAPNLAVVARGALGWGARRRLIRRLRHWLPD